MPKSQYVDPVFLRKSGEITYKPTPVCAYDKTVADEKKNFKKEDFLRIFHDMAVIREYETMLNSIKTTSSYHGIEYNNPGPAHLSAGQEAAAVGQAYILDKDDFVFGSHRSHGEIIAKALSAIQKCSDKELEEIMTTYMDGKVLKVVEHYKGFADMSVKEKAGFYFLYGTLAEIFAKDTGFSRGLGGSMHAFFTPFGIYPNNALVGGSADIALGAALYKKINRKKGIAIANIGDASMGCGPVWEAMMMSAMDQYRQLWQDDMQGGLPLIFNFFNNDYGMGGQTRGETMGFDFLARAGAGVNPDQMHSERVDGYNPLAVIDAMKRKYKVLEEKKGPVLLDIVTYRYSGHSPSDSSTYRTPEEIKAWQEIDPLVTYRGDLIKAKIAKDEAFDAILEQVKENMTEVVRLAVNEELSPRMDLVAVPDEIEKIMFSNQHIAKMEDRPCEVLIPDKKDNPRVQQIAKKERFGFDKDGKPVSKNKVFQVRDALFEAILDKFYEDPTLVAYGEENRDWGGAYAVYRGLTESIPYHRLFNSSISEAAIVGSAVGYGMCGGRALVELMYMDFLGRAGDEIFNQLPKWQAMTAGQLKMPVVVRMSIGSKYGAQHSQDWTALCAHIPGLKIVFPVTPYDCKGLMTAALNGTDPVIFLESQRLYDYGEQFHEGGVPTGSYEIEIGEPDVKVVGSDITLLTVGSELYNAVKAAKTLKEKYNISAEVIDARSIVPFNYEKVVESVKKTGKIVLISDACARNSVLKDMAANITELCFDYLDAPPVVVGARNWITPAFELEKHFFPQESWILDAIHQRILPLKDYVPTEAFNNTELMRTSKKGV